MRIGILSTFIFFILAIQCLFSNINVTVDKDIPKYQKVTGVSGSLSSIGSDSMNNLITLLLEGFQKIYPNVKIQVEGKGSSTAPPALISGTAQLGPMSRPMKNEEIDKFEEKFGYKPTEIKIALDALAIYVNNSNPINYITIAELDAIFSVNRKGGYKRNIATWGDIGLKNKYWRDRPISIYGRNSASGTYSFFKEHALFKGDFKNKVQELLGSSSVIQGISNDKYSIGYSGAGFKTTGVKILGIMNKNNSKPAFPDYDNILSGNYPLSRFMYLYINNNPQKESDLLVLEFIKFILSYEGQSIVVKDGFLPLTNDLINKELKVIK